MLLAWIDLETTGLDPVAHDIIEVAIVTTDEDLVEVDRFHAMVRPSPQAVDLMDEEGDFVRRVVGYSEERWRLAMSIDAVAPIVAEVISGKMLAGHCVDFDRGFLRVHLGRRGFDVDALVGSHRTLDTASLAYSLKLKGAIRSASLAAVCKYLGVEREQGHRAMPDILATIECARRLLGRMEGER